MTKRTGRIALAVVALLLSACGKDEGPQQKEMAPERQPVREDAPPRVIATYDLGNGAELIYHGSPDRWGKNGIFDSMQNKPYPNCVIYRDATRAAITCDLERPSSIEDH